MDEPIFFTTQDDFSDWIEGHADAQEVWVGYFKRKTGLPSLTWSETVDVALCFGWIDGIRKSIDDERYKIRFTPRKPKSVWSAVNVKKVKALIKEGKMRPEGLALFNARGDAEGYTSEDRNMVLSPDYEARIRANGAAWDFLSALAPSYKRETIWWVMSAKREDTRLKRLGILIESAEAGLKIPNLRK